MLLRTHLTIAVLVTLIFMPQISHPVLFSLSVLAATLIPDLDAPSSFFRKGKSLRLVQNLVIHRGVFHSFTFAFLASLILILFFPILGLGFFLGYSVHLFADSFTPNGITPFWPSKKKVSWKIKEGGYTESSIFWVFLAADLLVLALMIL